LVVISREDDNVKFRWECLEHNHAMQVHLYDKVSSSGGQKKRVQRVPLERTYMHPEIIKKTMQWLQQDKKPGEVKDLVILESTAWSKQILKKYTYTESEDYHQRRLKKVCFNTFVVICLYNSMYLFTLEIFIITICKSFI
jgi:hypothetical protein